jgi:hypothetical protein
MALPSRIHLRRVVFLCFYHTMLRGAMPYPSARFNAKTVGNGRAAHGLECFFAGRNQTSEPIRLP